MFNKALLSKLAWKVLTEQSFVFDFLRSRSKGKFDARFHLSSYTWPFLRSCIIIVYGLLVKISKLIFGLMVDNPIIYWIDLGNQPWTPI